MSTAHNERPAMPTPLPSVGQPVTDACGHPATVTHVTSWRDAGTFVSRVWIKYADGTTSFYYMLTRTVE